MRNLDHLLLNGLPFGEIAILGPGLLGGSLALALQGRPKVRIWGRNEDVIADVQRRQIASIATTDVIEAVTGADLIIFCTPIEAMPALARQILPYIAKTAVITDVGSVKTIVLEQIAPLFRDGAFVGSHPMAGSEKAGLAAAKADLFSGAVCVLTPEKNSPADQVARLANFWQSVGCTILQMSAAEHDAQCSRISHLPHLSAAALMHAAAVGGAEAFALAGQGMRDATRIAAGLPEMWSGILLANRENLLPDLEGLIANLQRSAELLRTKDEIGLKMFLTEAKILRDSLAQARPHGRDQN